MDEKLCDEDVQMTDVTQAEAEAEVEADSGAAKDDGGEKMQLDSAIVKVD